MNDGKKYEDTGLLLAVRRGDSQAYETLLATYRPLIHSLTASFVSTCGADPLETRVEAEYALYRAVLSFDLTRDAITFGLYAKVCIRNRLISHFARRKHEVATVSLDALLADDRFGELFGGAVSPDDALVDAESVARLSGRIRAVLSDYETEVFFLWVDAYTTRQIAAKVNRDEKSVANAISRSLTKLRQALS